MMVETRAGAVTVPEDAGNATDALRKGMGTVVDRLMYPYQKAYLADRSLRKFLLWSRQIGKTRTIAFENPVEALNRPGLDNVIVSASDNQVSEVLRTAVWWSDVIDDLAKSLIGKSIYKRIPTATDIEYWNGSRVLSRAANPRTAAGYHGNVTWDEASKTMHDADMWMALDPITSSGPYAFRMSGTPWGARGIFWQVCTGQKPGWSGHKTTIYDAVKQGCPRDVAYIATQYDALTFSQEFLCEFLSRQLCPFTPDFIQMCADLDLPPAPTIGVRMPDGKMPRYALGIDVGRTNDRTDILFGCEYPTGFYQVTRVDHLRGVGFQEQFNVIKPWLDNPGIEKVGIDATGLGMQLAEDCYRHAPGKVTQVHFANTNKNAMMELALARMGAGRVKVPLDSDLLTDLGSIERKILPSGAVTYQAPRTDKGHGDSAFAFIIWLSQLAEVGGFQFDFGYGQESNAGSMQDGRIDLLTGLSGSVHGLPPANPLRALLSPDDPSELFTEAEIRAMSPAEKAAYGLTFEAPVFGTTNPGPGGYGVETSRPYGGDGYGGY